MPSVDVVIPCYNYGRFLKDCVGSVLDQRGVDLRVLIIDNASQDDSVAVARALTAVDPRVDLVTHAVNRGATRSYNEGIDWAAADYFLILDADDLLAPGSLARATAALERHPESSFTHGIELRLEADGSFPPHQASIKGPETILSTGTEFIRRLCRTPVNNIGANTVVRRTSAQKKIGYYRPSLPYTDDLEMWLRLATTGSVVNVRKVQALRRHHPTRMSTHYENVQIRDFVEREAAFASFFAHEGWWLPESAQLLALARRGLGEHAYWSALSHISRGHSRTGAKLLRFSHRQRPRMALLPPLHWLLRMDRPLERVTEIAREVLRGTQQAPRPDGASAPLPK
jgi:glycosyltransferase involved in cell wall biosynthesis